jgi:hypothetical protein
VALDKPLEQQQNCPARNVAGSRQKQMKWSRIMRIEKWKMVLIAAGIGVGSLMATAGTASAQYWHHHHHRHCWRNGFGTITCTRVVPQSYTYRNRYYYAPSYYNGDDYYTTRYYRNGYYYGVRPDGVTIRIR